MTWLNCLKICCHCALYPLIHPSTHLPTHHRCQIVLPVLTSVADFKLKMSVTMSSNHCEKSHHGNAREQPKVHLRLDCTDGESLSGCHADDKERKGRRGLQSCDTSKDKSTFFSLVLQRLLRREIFLTALKDVWTRKLCVCVPRKAMTLGEIYI